MKRSTGDLCLFFGAALLATFVNANDKPELEPWQQAQKTEVWEPVPSIVQAPAGKPPSDAIVLFDQDSLTQWESVKNGKAKWIVNGDSFTVKPDAGDIRTRQSFCDVQLHLEWKAPQETEGLEGQARGNSGVFLQERYEVQVLDSYQSETYPNGQAASIYKQHIPLVNATRSPQEWNVYDIIFSAPRFDKKGKLVKPAFLTVMHNGVLVQNHVEAMGPTQWIGKPEYVSHGCAPLSLQDHGNPVSFRNIWIREL